MLALHYLGTVSSESILPLKVKDGCRKVSVWNHDGFSQSLFIFKTHTIPEVFKTRMLRTTWVLSPLKACCCSRSAMAATRSERRRSRKASLGWWSVGLRSWAVWPVVSCRWASHTCRSVSTLDNWQQNKQKREQSSQVFCFFFKHTKKLQSTTWKPLKFLWRHTSTDHLF